MYIDCQIANNTTMSSCLCNAMPTFNPCVSLSFRPIDGSAPSVQTTPQQSEAPTPCWQTDYSSTPRKPRVKQVSLFCLKSFTVNLTILLNLQFSYSCISSLIEQTNSPVLRYAKLSYYILKLFMSFERIFILN